MTKSGKKMKKSLQHAFLVMLSFLHFQISTQGNVIITLKPLDKPTSDKENETLSIIDKPQKIPAKLLEKKFDVVSGVLGRLNGQINFSDTNGQMIFMREKIGNTVNILVTESVKPVIYHGNTVHHWIIPDPQNASFYTATKTQNPENEIYSWQIDAASLPANFIVPQDTLVIFGKPSDVVITPGTFITRGDPHLVLPNFFVTKGISAPGAFMQYLKHSRLYRQLKRVYKDAQTYVSSLVTS